MKEDVEPEIVKDLPDGTKNPVYKETHKLPQEEEPEDEEEKEKEEKEGMYKRKQSQKKKKGLLRGMWSKTKNFAKRAYKKTKVVKKYIQNSKDS